MDGAEPAQGPGAAHNQRGQALGPKGRRTRDRIVAAALKLIEDRPLSLPSVAEIAQTAELSVPSFYVYFQDVKDVVAVLAGAVAASAPQLGQVLGRRWDDDDAVGHATALVSQIVDHEVPNYAVIHLRNHLGDEGDARFSGIRSQQARAAVDGLAVLIATGGRPDIACTAAGMQRAVREASLLYAMLERLAALIAKHPYGEKVGREDYVQAAAQIIVATIRHGRDAALTR